MDLKLSDVTPKTCEGCFCCGCLSAVGFVLTILFFPATVIQLGQLKYGLAKNTVTGHVNLESVFEPGRYWLGFWREFIEFPSHLCTIEFSDAAVEDGVQSLSKLRARDVEGKLMLIDVSLQYQLFPEELGNMYREMTTLYEDVFISELRDRLSKVCNRFKAEDIWEDYIRINTMMHEECIDVLRERHANCWGVQIWGLSLIELYERQLVQTQVRKQAKHTEQARLQSAFVRAETQVILAEYRKNITVIQAGGQAVKYNIEREARARAEGNLISVEARALVLVRDVLRGGDAGYMAVDMFMPTNGTVESVETNGTVESVETTEETASNSTLNVSYFIASMTTAQLLRYQKYMMLQRHTQAHLVYHASTPVDASMEAVNVASARTIMNNEARRLAEPLPAPEVPVLNALVPGPTANPGTLARRQHAPSMRVPTGFNRNAVGSLSSGLDGGEETKEL